MQKSSKFFNILMTSSIIFGAASSLINFDNLSISQRILSCALITLLLCGIIRGIEKSKFLLLLFNNLIFILVFFPFILTSGKMGTKAFEGIIISIFESAILYLAYVKKQIYPKKI